MRHSNELIESLSELEAQFAAQADLFALDGHDTEAAEQYGRAFGVARSIARVRKWDYEGDVCCNCYEY